MVFCKGEKGSVIKIKEALAHFSTVTGLVANMEKSNIILACMEENVKTQLMSLTGFSQGTLPIKYLGLPLSSKKWSKLDCQLLIEKIVQKIRTTYARRLSFAGRLQVVLAVLFSRADIELPVAGIKQVLEVVKKRHWRKFVKEIVAALISGIVYYAWRARNLSLFEKINISPSDVVARIKAEVVARIDIFKLAQKAIRSRSFHQRLCV
ncbi:uncharacterized protein LOC107864894 [Capsicum annuum]|uniref:uncharacterized protein LOC107864894 n=1 Tax=Capsicum annuum TaxID=4072 RepID=UPI001FB18937|nr:uncharacterized protein LOC107864894 [Capsicum annuum]